MCVFLKQVNNSDSGISTKWGGDDLDTLDKYFDNIDLTPKAPIVNTSTTFRDGKLKFRDAANTYSYTLKAGTLGANADVSLPAASGNITLLGAGGSNDFGDEVQTFRNVKIVVRNPANTFSYILQTSAILANRTLTLPLLTGNDTFTFNDFAAALLNKTINVDTNTLKHSTTNAQGDIYKYDTGSGKIVRVPRGTANQVLAVNAGNTDIGWTNPSAPGGDTIFSDMVEGGYKYGIYNGTGTTTISGYGLLGSLTNISTTPSAYLDTTNGFQGQSWPMSTSPSLSGWKTSGVITLRKLDPDLTVCFQLNEGGDDVGSRVWIGFAQDLSEALDNSSYLDSDIGVLLSKNSTEDYFKVTYNGGGSTQENTSSLLTTDSGIHTIRIFATEASAKWSYSLDGDTPVDLTTDIPAATDTLGVIVNSSQTDSASRAFRVFWAKMKAKERA